MKTVRKRDKPQGLILKAIHKMIDDSRRVRFSVIIISLMVLLYPLLFSGCATTYLPQATDRIRIVDNYAILEKGNVAFAIRPSQWTREPQRVSDFFTTFHIIIKNQSRETITISPGDIALLDQQRNQYDVMTVSDVADILFYDDMMYDKFSPIPDRYGAVTNDRIAARANLMQDAFHYGDIMSGARKSGYIFFRRIPARNRESTIIFRDEEIIFIRG